MRDQVLKQADSIRKTRTANGLQNRNYLRSSIVETQQAWPVQLEKMLKAQGHNVHIIKAGINGDTTVDMLKRVDRDIPSGTKIVILDIGGGFYRMSPKWKQPDPIHYPQMGTKN